MSRHIQITVCVHLPVDVVLRGTVPDDFEPGDGVDRVDWEVVETVAHDVKIEEVIIGADEQAMDEWEDALTNALEATSRGD